MADLSGVQAGVASTQVGVSTLPIGDPRGTLRANRTSESDRRFRAPARDAGLRPRTACPARGRKRREALLVGRTRPVPAATHITLPSDTALRAPRPPCRPAGPTAATGTRCGADHRRAAALRGHAPPPSDRTTCGAPQTRRSLRGVHSPGGFVVRALGWLARVLVAPALPGADVSYPMRPSAAISRNHLRPAATRNAAVSATITVYTAANTGTAPSSRNTRHRTP